MVALEAFAQQRCRQGSFGGVPWIVAIDQNVGIDQRAHRVYRSSRTRPRPLPRGNFRCLSRRTWRAVAASNRRNRSGTDIRPFGAVATLARSVPAASSQASSSPTRMPILSAKALGIETWYLLVTLLMVRRKPPGLPRATSRPFLPARRPFPVSRVALEHERHVWRGIAFQLRGNLCG